MLRLALLILLLLIPAADASAATLTGGAELRLTRLDVRAAGAASAAGNRVTLPAFAGTVGATSATLRHSGVLQVKGRNLIGLRTTLGARSRTTAVMDGKRLTLFTYRGLADIDDGTATLDAARVTLTRAAGSALGVRAGRLGRADIAASLARPATGVTWRPRESFVRYINSEDGRTEVSGGAENGPQEVRPGTDAPLVYSFVFPEGVGTLRFVWAARGIDLAFADPVVSGQRMSVLHAGERLDLLDLAAADQAGTSAATLTEQGAAVFNGFYSAGDEFGSVTVGERSATARVARKPAARKRFVALSPFTANSLVDLGTVPVAIANTLGGQDRFRPALDGVKRLELSHPNGPNLEQLASLRPDVVLSSPTWNRGHQAMRDLGMHVALADPERVRDVAARTRQLGRLTGRRRQADKLARAQVRDIAAAKRGISEHPRVLVVLGVGRAPYAFLPSSWGGDLITQAGGELLTEGLEGDGGFARISDEYVVSQDPEVIIAVPHGNAKDIPSIGDYMRDNPAWENTQAGRDDRVYIAYGNSLLQPFTDVGRMIADMRTLFLEN